MTPTEDEILNRYRTLVLEWATHRNDPKRANRVLKEHHAYYKAVRDVPEGRQALLRLLEDPEPSVRALAATHSLRFAPSEAEAVLIELERGDDLYSVDAKYTLINFRVGRLDLDW